MKELTEDLNELISNEPVLILQAGDETCAPCHAIRQRIDEWASSRPGVTARYIPLRENSALCAQMGIMSVPAVIAYIDGRLTEQKSGYFSLDDILAHIERCLEIRG